MSGKKGLVTYTGDGTGNIKGQQIWHTTVIN